MKTCRCRAHIKKVCLECGKTYEVCKYRNAITKYCSPICRGQYRGKERTRLFELSKVNVQCATCGKEFKVAKYRLGKAKYCSYKCMGVDNARPGEKSHLWKGGITVKSKLERTSQRYKDWRKGVFERDSYICQECGKGWHLHAHHVKEFAKFNELKFSISNGLTLCVECHRRKHKNRWLSM